jgi:hypothetical protein
MPNYHIGEIEVTGRNVSRPGGRKQKFAVVESHGKRTTSTEWPSLDLAMKEYQTTKHMLRENCKKPNGTVLKLMAQRKWSDNFDMLWTDESVKTIKQTTITPYSKMYSSKLKKIRGY